MKELIAYATHVDSIWGYILCILAIVGAYRVILFIYRILIPFVVFILAVCWAMIFPTGSWAQHFRKWCKERFPNKLKDG